MLTSHPRVIQVANCPLLMAVCVSFGSSSSHFCVFSFQAKTTPTSFPALIPQYLISVAEMTEMNPNP